MIKKKLKSRRTNLKDPSANNEDCSFRNIENEINLKGYRGDFLLKGSDVEKILSLSHNTLMKLRSERKIIPIVFNTNNYRYSAQEIFEYINRLKAERNNNFSKNENSLFNKDETEVLNTICAEFPDSM